MAPKAPDYCTSCGKPKSPDTFGTFVPKRGPDAGKRRLRTRCNECTARYRREWYARDPSSARRAAAADYKRAKQRNPQLNRERELRRNYGLSLGDYASMSNMQHDACAACWKPATDWLHVDHCHRDGVIRGLLCDSCNRALGAVDDNIEQLRGLILYLQHPPMRINLPQNSRARRLWTHGGSDGL